MSRAINAAGLDIIKRNEGCALIAYQCPAGIWTIGYGHTGSSVREGLRIEEHQAEVILEFDLDRFQKIVEEYVPGLNDNRFSALVSFTFNVGPGGPPDRMHPEGFGFYASTMRKRILEGDFGAASAEFPKWCHAGTRVLPGLVKRRAEERALFDKLP